MKVAHPEEIRRAGLDLPQCSELIRELRADGIELIGDSTTPEKCADMICAALAGGQNG